MAESSDSGRGVRRRAFLSAAAVGTAGLAGCLSRFRTARGQSSPEQVSLDILTVPADEDAVATEIGRMLSDHLDAAGVDTELVLLDRDELRRKTLIDREYDLFVQRHPNLGEPDTLRPLLHSSFTNEIGWQNPFEFANIDIDELLIEQQGAEELDRERLVTDLQHEIVRQQPFIPVAVPDTIRATRSDRFGSWDERPLDSSLYLLGVDSRDESTETLRLASTDSRMTRNLNPFAIEYRARGTVTGMLYDSLGRYYDDGVRRWAASDWEFDRAGSETVATVSLRPGLSWHDGEPLTAEDIVFTFDFLRDTSLGELEVPVPAPQFRGRTSLVEEVSAVDSETVEFTFPGVTPEVAVRTFTVPILPKAEWEERTEVANIAGIELSQSVTDALVWENTEPLGSGPLVFESLEEDESLELRRFDDHFLATTDDSPIGPDERFGDGIDFERLVVTVVRSNEAAVNLLAEDEIDAVMTTIDSATVPVVGRSPELDLRVSRSNELYLVGCNTANEPLGNPHFRRLIARMVDKERLVSTVFGDFATPAASPLAATDWLAPDLQWDGDDPELPFFGTADGLDVEQIREEFREIGLEYSDDDELLQP